MFQRRRIESSVAEVGGEFFVAVDGEDFTRVYASDGFEELGEVGVVGKGEGVIDAVAVDRVFQQCPAGEDDAAGVLEPRNERGACGMGRGDEDAALFQVDRALPMKIRVVVAP